MVGVGASAGGLEAFTQLLTHLPPRTGFAFALVQHLDPTRESHLSGILANATEMPVVEAKDGVRLEPDCVYVIPPNASMTVSEGTLKLEARESGRGQHLPIDHFFASLALYNGNRAIGVVLSGNASDGTAGLKAIKEAGGITFAQDEASAKFPGMPLSALRSECVDFVMPPDSMGLELARLGASLYVRGDPRQEAETLSGDAPKSLFKLLRSATGVDFASYRQTTIQRRLQRRLAILRIETLAEYLKVLERDPEEVLALFRDILIHVTSFFREPESFAAFRGQVLPALFEGRSSDDPFRIWVPGCSTGEEVYSLAISVLEFLGEKAPQVTIQIFGTDVSEKVIETARCGIYDASIEADLPQELLRRYFAKNEHGYQINKSVRDLCVFARQNVIKDPPFSKLDVISCRNLLIYFEPVLQKNLIPVFHFSLKGRGYLILGKAETVGAYEDLFAVEDSKNRIFRKRPSEKGHLAYFHSAVDIAAPLSHRPDAAAAAPQVWSRLDILKEADRLVAAKYCPPGLVVNDAMEIIQFRGEVAPYLNPDTGEASLNLFKMAHTDLASELGSAINAARKDGELGRRFIVRIKLYGEPREVSLEVLRIDPPAVKERAFVVNFRVVSPAPASAVPGKRSKREVAESAALAEELAATSEQLQGAIEERDATNEELRSANEEIQSTNEELQSMNEELETAKEELQSTNEELTTVNEEQWHSIGELTAVNDDMNNLLRGVCLPVLMLGRDLRIRRFTPDALKLFKLVPSDVGREITDIKSEIDLPNLRSVVIEVIETLRIWEEELQDRQGLWHRLEVRPYVTTDKVIAGAVLILFDIDAARRSDDRLRHAANYADAIISTVREPLVVLDGALRVKRVTQAFCSQFQVAAENMLGHCLYDLGNGQWNIPALRSLLEEVLPANERVTNFKVQHNFPVIGQKTMLLNAHRVAALNREEPVIVLSIIEVAS